MPLRDEVELRGWTEGSRWKKWIQLKETREASRGNQVAIRSAGGSGDGVRELKLKKKEGSSLVKKQESEKKTNLVKWLVFFTVSS